MPSFAQNLEKTLHAALTDAATTLVMALRELGRDSEADEIEKVVYAL